MLNLLTATVVALTSFQQVSSADTTGAVTDGDVAGNLLVFSGRAGRLAVAIPRIENPDISVDGRLDDPVWESAAVLTDFTQYEPVEGIPATEETQVRVFYSGDAIYFAIRAWDSEPDLILARLGERDRAVFTDDWIRIMLDTFDDQRQAYVFYVNPLGIQVDGLWIEGMRSRFGGRSAVSIDFNPDFIWESDGRVIADGWTAEMKIPYVSLRFREVSVQDWGLSVSRGVRRKEFKQSWAPLTRDVSSTLAQAGKLVGLRDIKPRKLVEINPVATGIRRGQETDGQFVRDGFAQDFGVNGRYGITQNLVLDATVNPDFSQVEADANRITVNERFALFFAEKRPFFLEGTEIFRSPRNLVHTRRIADPIGGAKLTGKIGSFNVGYLGAVDEGPKSLFGGDYQAVFNILRVRRDVGAGSTVGILYTDRTLAGGGNDFNRVLAGDARFLFNGRYTLTTQFAGSWTSTTSGPASLQPLVMAQLTRSGRNFGWQVKFDDVSPGFRTESGFIPRVGDTQTFGNIRYTHFGAPGSVLERVSSTLQVDAFFDHDEFWGGGTPFEAEVQLMPTFSFKGNRNVTVILRDGFFRFLPESYASYEVQGAAGNPAPFAIPNDLAHLKAIAVLSRARVTNAIQLNSNVFYREVPIFIEAARGLELMVRPDITVRPTSSLQLQLSHTFSRLWRQRDDTEFSTVHISRLRTQYQFAKGLLARGIVQYNLEDRSALRDPTTELPIVIDGSLVGRREKGDFQGQFLLQYEPSPGTIFFVGYTRLESGERTYRLSRMEPTEDGLFVKLSYLFRM